MVGGEQGVNRGWESGWNAGVVRKQRLAEIWRELGDRGFDAQAVVEDSAGWLIVHQYVEGRVTLAFTIKAIEDLNRFANRNSKTFRKDSALMWLEA